MKYRIRQYFLLSGVFVFLSCNSSDKTAEDPQTKKPAPPSIVVEAMKVVAPDTIRKEFKNLISIADCVSPLGKYTTQVNSTSDGYLYLSRRLVINPRNLKLFLKI